MARIRLCLLGGLEIFDTSNQPVQLSVKKARALLVYLAVQPQISFSRDQLAELLWPLAKSERARQSLRQAIADLRKHLPNFDDVIRVTQDDLQANDANLSVDLLNFKRLAKQQDPHAHHEANGYYGGPFLDGFSIQSAAFSAWREEVTQSAHEQFIYVLESQSEHQLLEGNINGAIELCQRLVKLDPVRESAHRNLMGLFAKQNKTDAAFEQYAICRQNLKNILGREPESQTENLYARIQKQLQLTNDTELPAKSVFNNIQGVDQILIPECAGRESEMNLMCSCIEHTYKTKKGQCIYVSGDNGIGKSYFLSKVSAFSQQLNMALAQTCFFDINSSHENGFRDLIFNLMQSPLLADNNELPVFIADQYFNNHPKYILYLATLYTIFDIQIPKRLFAAYSSLKPATREILTKSVIIEIMTQAANKQPLLLIIDDSQYITVSMRPIIRALLDLTRTLPIILVCATDSNSNTTIENSKDTLITSLKIPPLSREHIRGIYPELQSTPCIDILYLVWLKRASLSSEVQQAENLSDVLNHLKTNLNNENKHALNIATVLGMRFSPDVLNTLLDNPQYNPDTLIQQGYLHRFGHMLEFSHSLIQQQLYALLDHDLRHEIHFLAASYYLFGNAYLHAYHLDSANSPDTAKAYLSAALSAATDFKPDLAIHFFDKASDHALDNEVKYFSAIHRANLMLESDRVALAIQSYDHAQKYAADEQQQTHAWLGMAIGLLERRQYSAAFNLLERCEAILTSTPDNKILAKLYYNLAQATHKLNMPDAAIRYNKIAFEHAKLADSSYWQVRISVALGSIEFKQLNMSKAHSDLGFSLRLARENNHDDLEIKILISLAKIKLFQADFQGSNSDLEQAMQAASLIEDHQQMLAILSVLSLLDFYKGQFSRLRHHTVLATELYKLTGTSGNDNYIASYRLLAAYHGKDHEQQKLQIKAIQQTIDTENVASSYVVAPIMALTETDTNHALSYLNNALKTLSALNGPEALECCFISIEAAIQHQLWDIATDFADKLILLIKDEHLHFFIMCAERVRILSQVAQDEMTETTRTELVDIYVAAKQFGLAIHLPAYEIALNQLRDPIQV